MSDRTARIEIKDGDIIKVSELPLGWIYKIINHDNKDEYTI